MFLSESVIGGFGCGQFGAVRLVFELPKYIEETVDNNSLFF
jgi:hypothetical protein